MHLTFYPALFLRFNFVKSDLKPIQKFINVYASGLISVDHPHEIVQLIIAQT